MEQQTTFAFQVNVHNTLNDYNLNVTTLTHIQNFELDLSVVSKDSDISGAAIFTGHMMPHQWCQPINPVK